MFDKEKAEQHLKKMLRHYKIKVVKWSVSSCGRAYISAKEVKIPRPTDIDRFGVCMHEIKHIIDGIWGKLYQREFACEKFAIEQGQALGFDMSLYAERARRYIIMNIAKGYCRKLNLANIEPEIRNFCNIDFSEWNGHKVFVSGWGMETYEGKPIHIEMVKDLAA